MLVRPLPGVQRAQVRQALAEAHTYASNAYTAHQRHPGDRYNTYYEWAHRAARSLQFVISERDVSRLVLTPRYWALYSAPTVSAAPVAEAIEIELAARMRDLEAAYKELDFLAERWEQVNEALFVVLDTNIFLRHPDRIDTLDIAGEVRAHDRPVHLVIPMQVLDELDNQKDRGKNDDRTNARATIKILDQYLKDPALISEIRPAAPAHQATGPRGRFTVELLPDPLGHIPLARPDDEIIDRALALQALAGRPVVLVTGDIGMSTRARLSDLIVERITWSSS